MTTTLNTTAPKSPSTWDEAADKALEDLISSPFCAPVTEVAIGLRQDLDELIAQSFHGVAAPSGLLACMADDAAAALRSMEKLPSIEQLARLLADKQANYGSGNILAFGVKGIIIRISDKVARIENMIVNDRGDEVEPLEDAFIDIIGYATIARMLEEGTFELPLARDLPVMSAEEVLDEVLAKAFDETEHVDVLEFILGNVDVEPHIDAMLRATLVQYVDAGRPIPTVLRIIRL